MQKYIPLITLLVVVGCSPGTSRRMNTDFDKHKDMITTVLQSDRIVIYEGLPRPYEVKEFPEAKTGLQTFAIREHEFYQGGLDIKPEDLAKLKLVVGNEKNYGNHIHAKACGGFHPDFAVEWTIESKTYRCLICFSCQEAEIDGPDGELYCDMNIEGCKDILKHYRKNRPITESNSYWAK